MERPLKILLTGPESTGKTTLAETLAAHYRAPLVPEYARIYLETVKQPPYTQEDILTIAKAQVAWEDYYLRQADRFLFCDTGLMVLKVWSDFKYGNCHPWILEQLKQRPYDFTFLCGIDVSWEYDKLRENKNERKRLHKIFKDELKRLNCVSIELKGNVKARLYEASKSINSRLSL